MSSKQVIFASTLRALQAIEESHDFFSGSEAALETLRVEVLGLRAAYPTITQRQIAERFEVVEGRRGSNAYNLVVKRDLNGLLDLHRELRLTNLVSIFEGWDHAVVEELGVTDPIGRRLSLFFQQGEPTESLARILGPDIRALRPVDSAAGSHRLCRSSRLPAMRRCYRAFKEVRNALAHNDKKASTRTHAAYLKYEAVQRRWGSLSTSAPHLPLVVVGEPVSLTTDGVIRFADLLQKFIITFDAALAGKAAAGEAVASRWVEAYGRHVTLPADRSVALLRFESRWINAGFPKLEEYIKTFAWFRSRGLIS